MSCNIEPALFCNHIPVGLDGRGRGKGIYDILISSSPTMRLFGMLQDGSATFGQIDTEPKIYFHPRIAV
jgi:hypothetical protein